MNFSIETFKDGGQWFARIHQDNQLWWEGWLCEEQDNQKVVAAVALNLAIADCDDGRGLVKQLSERGIKLASNFTLS
jgi:hypothetical protein